MLKEQSQFQVIACIGSARTSPMLPCWSLWVLQTALHDRQRSTFSKFLRHTGHPTPLSTNGILPLKVDFVQSELLVTWWSDMTWTRQDNWLMSGLSICKFSTGPELWLPRPWGLKRFLLSWDNQRDFKSCGGGLWGVSISSGKSCTKSGSVALQALDGRRGSYLWILCTLLALKHQWPRHPWWQCKPPPLLISWLDAAVSLEKSPVRDLITLELRVPRSKSTNCWLSHRFPNLTGRRTRGPSEWCQWTMPDSSSGNVALACALYKTRTTKSTSRTELCTYSE